MESLEIILEKYDGTLSGEEKEALATEKNEAYRELLKTMSPEVVSEEVRSTLDELRARGYRLAIGSSSKNARFILEKVGLLDFFDAISDGNNIKNSKPDPEVFLLAARKLGVRPEDCAVVEDAGAGIEAAGAGGMTALALFGDAKGCGLEDYDLNSFRELLELLP